eukprot:1237903-Pyramimonas_sp.AAC.1
MDPARRRAAQECRIFRRRRAVAWERCCCCGRCWSSGAMPLCGFPRRSLGSVATGIGVSRTGPFPMFSR